MTANCNGGPAFPIGSTPEEWGNGMTLRQYAAITLRVPQSGDGWLDDMITEARRQDLFSSVAAAPFAHPGRLGTVVEALEKAAEVVEAARSISRFNAALAARGEAPSCNWEYSEQSGCWKGDCGIAFTVEAGSPAENDMGYCPKCGRKLVEASTDQQIDDGWIKWGGGDCPEKPTKFVEVKLRDGRLKGAYSYLFAWKHFDNPSDIIAYRVVEGAGS